MNVNTHKKVNHEVVAITDIDLRVVSDVQTTNANGNQRCFNVKKITVSLEPASDLINRRLASSHASFLR